jgi:hypothetical protein
MSNELANHKREQQRAVDLPNPPNDQDGKASMQFLNGLVDGLAEDDFYAARHDHRPRGPAWRKRISMEAWRDVGRWLLHFNRQGAGPGNRLHIQRPPGFRLAAILRFICREKTWERVIEPMHADLLAEYYSVLNGGQCAKAALLQLQMHFYLVHTVLSERLLQMLGAINPFKRSDK